MKKIGAGLFVLLLIIAALVALTIIPDRKRAQLAYAKGHAAELRAAALAYVAAHAQACPTVHDLRTTRIIGERWNAADPWRREMRIFCKNGFVVATSAGPDGEFQTEDDVVAPEATTPARRAP